MGLSAAWPAGSNACKRPWRRLAPAWPLGRWSVARDAPCLSLDRRRGMHAISCGEAVPACDALWGGGACIEYPVRGVQGSYSCLATFSATLTLTGAYSCTAVRSTAVQL